MYLWGGGQHVVILFHQNFLWPPVIVGENPKKMPCTSLPPLENEVFSFREGSCRQLTAEESLLKKCLWLKRTALPRLTPTSPGTAHIQCLGCRWKGLSPCLNSVHLWSAPWDQLKAVVTASQFHQPSLPLPISTTLLNGKHSPVSHLWLRAAFQGIQLMIPTLKDFGEKKINHCQKLHLNSFPTQGSLGSKWTLTAWSKPSTSLQMFECEASGATSLSLYTFPCRK